jgi:hypothetical protein
MKIEVFFLDLDNKFTVRGTPFISEYSAFTGGKPDIPHSGDAARIQSPTPAAQLEQDTQLRITDQAHNVGLLVPQHHC